MKPPLPVQTSCLDPAAFSDPATISYSFERVVVATCPVCGRPIRMKRRAIPSTAGARTHLTCSCRAAFLVEFTSEQVYAVYPLAKPSTELSAPPEPVAAPERPAEAKPSDPPEERGHLCFAIGCNRRVRWFPRLRGWKKDGGIWFCPQHSDYTRERALIELGASMEAFLSWQPEFSPASPGRSGDTDLAKGAPPAIPAPLAPVAPTPGEILLDAAGRGDAETVARLLGERGFDPGQLGEALVRSVSYRGSVDTARLLIRAGAEVGNTQEYGAIALGSAVRMSQYEMLELLVASGADPTREDEPGHSPLEWAVSRRNGRALDILRAACPTGMNAVTLTGAAKYGALDLARRALDSGVPVDAKNGYGTPAILVAAQAGHADVVQLLLERGADPNSASDGCAETALTAAVCGGSAEVVRTLVAAGADVNTPRTFDNGTPRSVADWLGRSEIYRILAEAGAR